jgi:DNA (cytosine-5)-methyltransferase 1
VAWGAYGPAIARWEAVTGRLAPRPTEPGRTGERLSPRFVEWMQGLPAGWVTDVLGMSRNAQLKALGNGVVPQQAELALRLLLKRAGFASEAVDAA